MPWWWPWGRTPEPARAPRDYSEAMALGLLAQAQTPRIIDPGASGAVRAAATAYALAFAGADVTTNNAAVRDALTPDVLAAAGAAFVDRGEFVALPRVEGMTLQLEPVAITDARGTRDDASYRITRYGPTTDLEQWERARSIVRVVYRPEPGSWRAAPPWAGPAAVALAAAEASLADEFGGPVGQAYAVPQPVGGVEASTFHTQLTAPGGLIHALRTARGNVVAVEATSGQEVWREQDAVPTRTQSEAMVRRYGPAPAQSTPQLVAELRAEVAAACGLPPVLVNAISPVSSQREGMRSFIEASVAPTLATLAAGLRDQLGADDLDLQPKRLTDIAPRARAVGVLVNAGMGLDEARAVVGL